MSKSIIYLLSRNKNIKSKFSKEKEDNEKRNSGLRRMSTHHTKSYGSKFSSSLDQGMLSLVSTSIKVFLSPHKCL